MEYIGLIAAAGHATRLNYHAGSKEIYPLMIQDSNGEKTTYPVCKCLLDIYSQAGIKKTYLITRKEKQDIEITLSTGEEYGLNIKYLYCDDTFGPPYTLDYAYEYVKNKYYVAFGFPDILIRPQSALKTIIQKQHESNADVVLALIKTDTPNKMDMLVIDDDGKIQDLNIKPRNETDLKWTWALAAWNPKFSVYMHDCLKKLLPEYEKKIRSECHVGTIFQCALKDDIVFDYVFINDGELVDMGTPEDLERIQKNPEKWFK